MHVNLHSFNFYDNLAEIHSTVSVRRTRDSVRGAVQNSRRCLPDHPSRSQTWDCVCIQSSEVGLLHGPKTCRKCERGSDGRHCTVLYSTVLLCPGRTVRGHQVASRFYGHCETTVIYNIMCPGAPDSSPELCITCRLACALRLRRRGESVGQSHMRRCDQYGWVSGMAFRPTVRRASQVKRAVDATSSSRRHPHQIYWQEWQTLHCSMQRLQHRLHFEHEACATVVVIVRMKDTAGVIATASTEHGVLNQRLSVIVCTVQCTANRGQMHKCMIYGYLDVVSKNASIMRNEKMEWDAS